jgi:hypothetical protein
MLKNWAALTRYCGNGNLLIDNNCTERSLRSFAVPRNNRTFFGQRQRRQDRVRAAGLRFVV